MNALRVYQTKHEKIRMGSPAGDGGYVVITGQTYDCLISGGVDDNIDFEHEFLETHNVLGYCYDGTISKPPLIRSPRLHFIKKNIGIAETDSTTNLHTLLQHHQNVFVKMDIETFEYRWLETLTTEMLSHVKQLVIEFHFPFTPYPFRHLDENIAVQRKMAVLQKLTATHTLVHFHGNNCCGTTHFAGVRVPNVFECTYIRNDVVNNKRPNQSPIPSSLDRPNLPAKPDITINWPPFVSSAS